MRSVSPKINDERRPPGEVGHQLLSRRGSLGSSFHDGSVAQRRASERIAVAPGARVATGVATVARRSLVVSVGVAVLAAPAFAAIPNPPNDSYYASQ